MGKNSSEFNNKKRNTLSFVKSLCLLLVTLIILIVSVVAWFKLHNNVTANGIKVSVDRGEIINNLDVDVSDDYSEDMYLNPIKPEDLTADDISYYVCTVETSGAGEITVNVTPNEEDPLSSSIRYILTDSDDKSEWLSEFQNDGFENSNPEPFLTSGSEDIYVVFYCEYDEELDELFNEDTSDRKFFSGFESESSSEDKQGVREFSFGAFSVSFSFTAS